MRKRLNNKAQGGGYSLSVSKRVRLCYALFIVFLSVLLCVAGLFSYNGNVKSDAYTTGATPTPIGSLTYSNYATRTDDAVFDSAVLNKLYDKILTNSGSTDKGTYANVYNKVNSSQSVTKKGESSGGGTLTQQRSMNYTTLSGGATAPSPIIVEFGGMKWAAVYLSTNTTMKTDGSKPDLILTLLATENSAQKYKFAEGHSGAGETKGGYPQNIYATSSVRVKVLNAGGDTPIKYAVGNSATYSANNEALYRTGTVSQTDRINNVYSQFTLSKDVIQKKSLTDYLVAPKYMELQRNEEFWNVYGQPNGGGLSSTTYANSFGEGWERGAIGGTGHWGNYYTQNIFPSLANYEHFYEWENDYLWLPSITELGYTVGPTANWAYGLWGIPSHTGNDPLIALSNDDAWSRSTHFLNATNNISFSGWFTAKGNSNTATLGVRPALHLNLTKAAASVIDIPEVPASASYTYNGLEQTIDLTTFTNFDTNKMYISNIAKKASLGTVAPSVVGTGDSTTQVKVTDAGTYTVTLKTKTGTINGVANSKYYWNENTASTDRTETKIEFTVKKKQLTKPQFTSAAALKDYSGEDLIFNAPNYPNTNVAATATAAYPNNPLSATISRKVNGTVSPPPNAPVKTEKADGTLDIKVRDAGDYTATFHIEDIVNYEWTDGSQTDHTADFKVKPKELAITYTTDEPSGAFGWAMDEAYKATFTISGVYNGDDTASPQIAADVIGLQLKFTKDGDSSFTGSVTATANGDGTYTAVLDNTAFPGSTYAVGSYPVSFEFDTSGTHNANYTLPATINGVTGLKLNISASAVSYTPQWQYTEGTGTAQAVPLTNKFKYKVDSSNAGVVYTISLDQSDFADKHLSIDTSKYNNGIENEKASNAGTYKTTVALKVADGYEVAGQTEFDVTYTWEIEKGDIDLSNLKWQYTTTQGSLPSSPKNYPVQWNATDLKWEYLDAEGNVVTDDIGVPWYGENYTLTLTGFPTGVTITNPTNAYNGTNKKKFIGNYTTECVGVTYDTVNYNALPVDALKLNWSIVKAQIEITSTSWSVAPEGAGGSNIFYVPVLANVSGVEYEYWDLGTATEPLNPAKYLGAVTDIEAVSGSEHNYYVVAKVKNGVSTDGKTLWTDAIELVDKTGGITVNGDTVLCAKTFMTGDNKTPVEVTLNGAPFTYDGKEHGVLNDGSNNGELSILIAGTSNNFSVNNFTVEYYQYSTSAENHLGDKLSGAPKDAGAYVIVIQLTDTAAEDYYTTAQYVEFEIKPFQLDLSQVKWGYIDKDGNEVEYDPTKPLQYTKDENGIVEHELILIGLPKGDAEGDDDEKLLAQMFAESGLDGTLLTYTGNKEGAVGAYNAKVDFGALSGNFAFSNIPSFITSDEDGKPLSSEQSWKIDPRKVNTPKSDNTHTFTGEWQDILSYAGMDPEGFGMYYTLTGLTKRDTRTNEAVSLFPNANPTDEQIKEALAGIKDAGRYGISVALIDAPNTEFNENGAKGTLPVYSAQITINKMKVTVSGWQGDGNSPWQVSADPTGFLDYRYEGEDGSVVPASELINHMNEAFKQTVVPSAGNEENIEIDYASDEVDREKTFLMLDMSNPPDPITKPTANATTSVVYDGAAHSFLPNGLEQLLTQNAVKLYAVDSEGNETEVDKEYFTQTKAGSYKVIVKISGNYYWDGTNNDKTPIEFTFEIEKLKLTGAWDTDADGMPIVNVPDAYKDWLEYTYLDADGNKLSKDDLTKGKDYTVSVSVKGEHADSVELTTTDKDGNEVESEQPFTMPGRNTLANMIGLPEDFPLIQVALTILFTLLFIIFLIMWIKHGKDRKASKEIIEQYEDLNV